MDGHAKISSFEHLAMDPESKTMLDEMQDKDGKPTVCDQVWISYAGGRVDGAEGHGKLTTGYGARLDASAWGGKSLHTDYRPPSAGPYEFNEQQLKKIAKQGKDLKQTKLDREKATGHFYQKMLKHVKHVLADVGRLYPEYDEKRGYELAGFVWFQGWNDLVATDVYPNRSKPGGYDLYSELMTTFIRDVRKDLKAPKLPFVIGVLGVNGPVDQFPAKQKHLKKPHANFRLGMAAPAKLREFKGNVTAVFTENYWDSELGKVYLKNQEAQGMARKLRKAGNLSAAAQKKQVDAFRDKLFSDKDRELMIGITNKEYHYLGSAKILGQIGKAFAEAMLEMQ